MTESAGTAPLDRFAAALRLYQEFQQRGGGPRDWRAVVAANPQLVEYLDLLHGACPATTSTALETPALPNLGWLALEPGREFGRYRITRFLGQGGMGSVFLAEHLGQRREIALKVLRDEADSPTVRERFAREAHAASRLDHPNICPVYEYDEFQGVPYIAMAYIEGESLHTRICRSRTTGAATRASILAFAVVLQDVARALHYAHERGVVHRDVKPSNILVARGGRPILVDFGIARDVDNAGLTLTGGAVGTVRYMAPEQLRGEPPTRTVDVYGLGMTLYECLTGQTAFGHCSPADMEAAILYAPIPKARSLERAVSADMEAVLARALAKRPGARYGTAIELADDFMRAATGRPTVARPPGLLRSASFWIVRNRAAATLIAGATLAALILMWTAARRDVEVATSAIQAWMVRTQEAIEAAPVLEPPWPSRQASMAAWLQHAAEPALAASARLMSTRRVDADTLTELRRRCDELQRLVDDMRARHQAADTSTRLAHRDHALLWRQARTAILAADDKLASRRYANAPLDLVPQLGLVPIGANPQTGLWEFYHLASGASEPPSIDAYDADGRLPIAAAHGIVFVLIPGGTYVVGASDDGVNASPHNGGDDELEHRVRLDPFFLGKYELTLAQWQRLLAHAETAEEGLASSGDIAGRSPARSSRRTAPRIQAGDAVLGDRLTQCHPVLGRSYDTAIAVLSRHGLTLPTEVQWEAACRAGSTGAWYTGDSEASLQNAANARDRTGARVFPEWAAHASIDDGHVGPAVVATFLPNAFGLFDMHGNAYESCLDWYGSYQRPARAGDGLRDVLPEQAFERVMRGGCFSEAAQGCRSALRAMIFPQIEDDRVGLRPARPVLRSH